VRTEPGLQAVWQHCFAAFEFNDVKTWLEKCVVPGEGHTAPDHAAGLATTMAGTTTSAVHGRRLRPSGPTVMREIQDLHAIHNARIQLLASALNNLGVGAIIAGIVAPLVNGTVGDAPHIGAGLAFGADLMTMAQVVLGRLRT
jgi:hypothetical protein